MKRQVRTIPTQFRANDDNGNLSIDGYFAVFDSIYEIAEGMTESIEKGAFTSSMENDVRALVNHDSTLVLGRTKAQTLELKQDDHGLWGHVDINPNDTDAMNLYARVQRGDVDQCSFGFFIRDEEPISSENGSVHWTIKDVDLFEVSCCTFPAYEETNIQARTQERANIQKRELESFKIRMKERLSHGTKSIDAPKED